MGAAYRAVDTRDKSPCVVKFLSEILSRSSEHLERFFREARATSRIDHPGIVRYRDSGKIGERHYLCVEFVEGVTLESHVLAQGGRIGADESLRILVQIARAAGAAHAGGIVHRDLTARNVLVTPSGDIKVIDFGIARISEEATITVTGRQFGTPSHMPPEQFGTAVPVDPRIDIWAAGVLLYGMVTGKKPFDGETPMQTIQKIINPKIRPDPPSTHVPGLPARLDQVILWMLRKDPAMRPATFDAVIDAIEARVDPPAIEEYFTFSQSATFRGSDPSQTVAGVSMPERRSRLIPWAAAAAAVIMAILVFVAVRQPSPPHSPAGSATPTPAGQAVSEGEGSTGEDAGVDPRSTGLPSVCSTVLMEDPRLLRIYAEGRSILQVRPSVGGVKAGKVFIFHPRKTSAESLKLKAGFPESEDPEDGDEISLKYVGVSTDNQPVGPDQIARLDPFSQYEQANLLDRVRQSRTTIFATVFRVYRLPNPVRIPRKRGRLWLRLENEISLAGAVPVLEDGEFARMRQSILTALK